MGQRTSYAPGTFCWVELATSDAGSAKTFYGALLGWEAQDLPGGDGTFTVCRLGGLEVSGLFETNGTAPAWLSYVSVEEADAMAARAASLGGTVVLPPVDVGTSGRRAVLADATGAVFGFWQPRDHIGARLVNDVGAFCLNQLNTSDVEEARRFLGGLFGWRFQFAGTDEAPYWGIFIGDHLNGGMMPLPPDAGAPSHWLVYFTVAVLDAAEAQIGEMGGRVLVPPMAVPGGRIAVATDPQGAVFGLFEGHVDP